MNRPATRSSRDRWQAIVTAVILVGLALAGYRLRRHMIASFFARTPVNHSRKPALEPAHQPDIGAAPRVRVVLLDGLDRRIAERLPALSRLCKSGWDLQVNVGFPTVSLPAQTVLWTGLTQEQAGVRYVTEHLDPPPAQSLHSPGSVAISELHPYLVHSFGFDRAEPGPDGLEGEAKDAWLAGFEDRVRQRLGSDATLVFIHVGRIDVAGHRHGRASPQYQQAADTADRWLARWTRGTGDDIRWFVLSDHGHLAGGGHAGAEEAIRMVRACVFGAGIEPMTGASRVHLVNLSHTLFSSTGQPAPEESAGRPVKAVATGAVALGTTLPPPPPASRLLLAALLLGLGVAITAACARRQLITWPLWLPIAYLGVTLAHGFPSLSMPMVYPPLGRDIYVPAIPGLLLLTASLVRVSGSWPRRIAAQLALPVALALGAWLASGGAAAHRTPPLTIGYTANASVLLVLTYAGALAAALAALVSVGLSAFGRDSAGENQRTAT